MSSDNMIPENIVFVQRGEKKIAFEFAGYQVEAKIHIFTNREVDEFMKEFLKMDIEEPDVDNAGMAEERLLRGLLDINTTFQGKKWPAMSEAEKKVAVQSMHPKLRDKIGKEIFGEAHLTRSERDFLPKLS